MRSPRESEWGEKGRSHVRTSGIGSDSWLRMKIGEKEVITQIHCQGRDLEGGALARPRAAQELGRVSFRVLVIRTEIQLNLVKSKRRLYWLLVSKTDRLLKAEARQWCP